MGVAASLSPEANYNIRLGGSFELGKIFTIAAVIADPDEGLSLELDLPKGLERVEGKRIQPVPAAGAVRLATKDTLGEPSEALASAMETTGGAVTS